MTTQTVQSKLFSADGRYLPRGVADVGRLLGYTENWSMWTVEERMEVDEANRIAKDLVNERREKGLRIS